MKRFKYIVMALVVAVGSSAVFTSCEDSDKFRFPELSNGGFVKFVFQPDFWEGIEFNDASLPAEEQFSIVYYHIGEDPTTASFDALAEDPSGNVASYEVFVNVDLDGYVGSASDPFQGELETPATFKTTTTFPLDVSFTAADIASVLGLSPEDFQAETVLEFTTRTTLTNGTVYNSNVASCTGCPDAATDEDGNPLDPGAWNGGTIDGVLLQGGDTGENFLLPAIFYRVKYEAPSE